MPDVYTTYIQNFVCLVTSRPSLSNQGKPRYPKTNAKLVFTDISTINDLYLLVDSHMSDLFKKKEEHEKRSHARLIRFTGKELEQIQENASIRNLDFSEYMRRTALGRKADVRFDQKIVLTLSQLVQEIRSLYAISVENKTPLPPDVLESLRSLIIDSGDAILRISK
jgi:hypothetical protein